MYGTATLTQTRTFTLTEARYVTSKIAADLDFVRQQYGGITQPCVTDYAEEAAILLSKRYLKSVEYGFKRNGKVIFTISYKTKNDGSLVVDDRPGKIPYGIDLSGSEFYTFLQYTDTFFALTETERQSVKNLLPVKRNTGAAPIISDYGSWEQSRSYAKNGEGVERSIFR